MSGTVRAFCLRILESGDLAAKLAPPAALVDREPGPAVVYGRPARARSLEMGGGAERLPHPRELVEPAARAACLRRFAHHELMAVELFAWALLAWPEAPAGLRRGWLATLVDEQRHCALYLGRLRAHGGALGDERLSDYFWRHAPAIRDHPRGPAAFLAAMGLTLEQANLDFSLRYRDGFRAAGDGASARVAQEVHADEVRHVGLAARWLARLRRPGEDERAAYEACVPFPLGAARAKGRDFRAAPRRAAGLGEAFIEHVRRARRRPHPDTGPVDGGPPPTART